MPSSNKPSPTSSWVSAGKTTPTPRSASPQNGPISDEDIIAAIVSVLRVDAFNHRDLRPLDGRLANGMSVMFMGASTGCNTVYGSTPPSTTRIPIRG
jgi:hypothetical protein